MATTETKTKLSVYEIEQTEDNIFDNKLRIKVDEDISLFNDPRWKTAKKNMNPEDFDHYQNIGEQFHGSIDYTSGVSNEIPIPKPIGDSIAYIEAGLRSGLLPDDLDENEQKLMEQYLGKNWKSKY